MHTHSLSVLRPSGVAVSTASARPRSKWRRSGVPQKEMWSLVRAAGNQTGSADAPRVYALMLAATCSDVRTVPKPEEPA
jgi:hypothetical protein